MGNIGWCFQANSENSDEATLRGGLGELYLKNEKNVMQMPETMAEEGE